MEQFVEENLTDLGLFGVLMDNFYLQKIMKTEFHSEDIVPILKME